MYIVLFAVHTTLVGKESDYIYAQALCLITHWAFVFSCSAFCYIYTSKIWILSFDKLSQQLEPINEI